MQCSHPAHPASPSLPQATTASNFGHVCLRKMFALCARGGGGADPDGCRLDVARLALPVFMARCDAVLRAYGEDQAAQQPGGCVLEAGGRRGACCQRGQQRHLGAARRGNQAC